ncbi:hypothetical protein PUR61_00725, partial [Streptomyces sp. BE20]|uniref:hypothetical protein n=1 Tax=Streptomyces sp. BE20 TaxID=3002525 RepID=UPI002E779FE9
GDRNAALATITEAVTHYRTHADTDPPATLPDLARAGNNLANHQTGRGTGEAALASSCEAVGFRRRVAGRIWRGGASW